MLKYYVVTRDCCTSGNCFYCSKEGESPTPFGKPARIEHIRTLDKVVAERCVKGWSSYHPTLTTEVTD